MSEKDTTIQARNRRIEAGLFGIFSAIGISQDRQALFEQFGESEEYYEKLCDWVVSQIRALEDSKYIRVRDVRNVFLQGITGHREIPLVYTLLGETVRDEDIRSKQKNASTQLSKLKLFFEKKYLNNKSEDDRFF